MQSVLRLSPLSGHLFIFFNRRKDQVRILFWDRSGYVVWAKRLERGRFALPSAWTDSEAPARIEAAELSLILEGVRLQARSFVPAGSRRLRRALRNRHDLRYETA